MAKRQPKVKYVQPQQVAGAYANGLAYSWPDDTEILLLDFVYTPFETSDAFIVARVHVPPSIARTLKKAVDDFLKAQPATRHQEPPKPAPKESTKLSNR